jgi:protocatechuate 3,4-dioxygenase beta subunit
LDGSTPSETSSRALRGWLRNRPLPLFSIFFAAAALFAQQSQPGAQPAMPDPNNPPAPQPSPTKPEDLCGIEGQVTSVATGAPVKKAELRLQRVDLNPNTGSMQTSYSTTADAAGKFAMKDIEPGKYRLSVSRNGFVNASYGARGPNRLGATISLDAGQHLKEVNFKLTPHGVVSGRIVDEDGDPVASVSVQAQTYHRIEGRKQLVPSGFASTNDLGEYRIFGLAPGRYYLSATYSQPMWEPTQDRSAKSPPEEGYVATYYPNGIDLAAAAAVEVTPGADIRGMNIALSKTHTVRLRGHVGHPGGGKQNVMIMLTPRDEGGWFSMAGRQSTDPQGNFEIRGVRPGAYTLTAQSFDGAHSTTARLALDVGNNNMEGIALTLSPGAELPGQIKAESPQGVDLTDIHISLQPHDPSAMRISPYPGDHVKDDGTFTLTQVSQERYDVYVRGLPDGYYVKSIEAGDQEVRDAGLDMTSGPAGSLSVTIGPGAGQIEGSVQNEKQQSAAGALVVLIPDDAKRRERRDAYHTATSDQYGRFTLKGLDPGEYKLYAWDDLESGAYMDPDVMKPFESKGVTMSIHENSRETAQLTLIPQ